MRQRFRVTLLTLSALFCLSIALGGCGKKEEPQQQTPDQQQLRKEKKGD